MKTHSCESGPKKDVRHTTVCYLEKPSSHRFQPLLSLTTGLMYTKFTDICPPYRQPCMPIYVKV